MAPEQVRKRDGSLVPFQLEKITAAIGKALATDGKGEPGAPDELAREVVQALPAGPVPTVEQIQDLVEETLIRHGLPRTAKGYILYRQRRAEIRQAKELLGVRDQLKLTVNAALVLRRRYLQRDAQGEQTETPEGLFRRVAHAVAAAEAAYGDRSRQEQIEEAFYRAMVQLDFLPNSPTLMNAGTEVGQLSACFVLPVEDSIAGIFEALRCMAIVHKSGGGTGFSFSGLRPRGDVVRSTMGVASGPLSFMRIFDVTTEVIKQGGRRRGANMGILRCDHPDILDFIQAKQNEGTLDNFNLSVGLTEDFMRALEQDGDYVLRNPRDGEAAGTLRASEVFGLLAAQAWSTGDPGVLFLDAIERANPTPELGRLEATNPCGEQPLLPWESCNLGSINLRNFVRAGQLDRTRLRETAHLALRFLDDVIDVNRYPLEETRRITLGNRKVGLGVMGFADALTLLDVPYDSERAVALADEIGALLQTESRRASEALAAERGPFPNHGRSAVGTPRRNATTTSIAPTGTISIIAGCSSGIEPLFALSFVRNVIEGSRLAETNSRFESVARDRGFLDGALMGEVARSGSIQRLERVPVDVRRVFVTAHDIAPEWHVRMQAAFQRHCDNAVSKTINFPRSATPDQVARAFRLAHESGCKGITVFRDGSKSRQVLTVDGPPVLGDGVPGGPRCDC